MLINKQERGRNSQVSSGKTAFIRHLLISLAIFAGTMGYSRLIYSRIIVKFASDPVWQAKIIDQMVIYHFFTSQLLGGVWLGSTVLAEERED